MVSLIFNDKSTVITEVTRCGSGCCIVDLKYIRFLISRFYFHKEKRRVYCTCGTIILLTSFLSSKKLALYVDSLAKNSLVLC